jgi:hypothetical protein
MHATKKNAIMMRMVLDAFKRNLPYLDNDNYDKEGWSMNKKTVGLALGGGSARGFAHIGVISAFEKHGVPMDLITGCSMGAIIGGAFPAAHASSNISLAAAPAGILFLAASLLFLALCAKRIRR